jgi:hypothetical protein
MLPDDRVRLLHMIEALETAERFVAGVESPDHDFSGLCSKQLGEGLKPVRRLN